MPEFGMIVIQFLCKGGAQPTIKDKENLPYTAACLLETQRFYSFLPMGLPHKTTCDTDIGEHDKGTDC